MIRDTILDTRYTQPTGWDGAAVTYGIYWRKNQNGADTPWDHSHENNYTCSITSKVDGIIRTGVWRYTAALGYHWYYSNANTGWPGFTQAWTSNDDLALLGKLADKYREHGFNAGTFGGELGEAVDMIFDRGRQILAAGKAVKRGRLDRAAKILTAGAKSGGSINARTARGLARNQRRIRAGKRTYNRLKDSNLDKQRFDEAWLELQWGWKPLLSDVYELSKLIESLTRPRKKRIVVRKRKKGTCTPGGPNYAVEGAAITRKQIIAYVNEVDFPILDQIGLDDPLGVAWELTPFSCIVDYFLPIGNYLKARNFTRSVNGNFITTKTVMSEGKQFLRPDYVNPSYPRTAVQTALWKEITVTRVVSTSLSVPMPRFQFKPFIENPLKVANVAALLGALFLGV